MKKFYTKPNFQLLQSVETEKVELSQLTHCGGTVSTLGAPQPGHRLDESSAR